MEARAGSARGWRQRSTYGGLMGQKTTGRPEGHQATAGAAAYGSSATCEHHVVTADARPVAQHAPPFLAQLPTVTWPDSASTEANQASPCAAATPAPPPLLRQLRRSTETTGTPEAASTFSKKFSVYAVYIVYKRRLQTFGAT